MIPVSKTVPVHPPGNYAGFEPVSRIQPFSSGHSDTENNARRSFANMNMPRIPGVDYDQFGVANEKDLVEQYLTIHSADRDRSRYPNPSQFVVRLDESATGSLTGVRKVKLLGGILPSANNATLNEPFLILRIPELSNGHLTTNNAVAEGAFSYLQLDRPLTETGFVNLRNDFNCMSSVVPYSSTVKQLSISILKYDGSVFDFTGGSPDNGAVPDTTKNFVLFFKIQKSPAQQ